MTLHTQYFSNKNMKIFHKGNSVSTLSECVASASHLHRKKRRNGYTPNTIWVEKYRETINISITLTVYNIYYNAQPAFLYSIDLCTSVYFGCVYWHCKTFDLQSSELTYSVKSEWMQMWVLLIVRIFKFRG